ncbi:hypothetical protein G436_2616 [Leptospira interrogans serovar Hardjo str. Norma]|uniref:Uncharacterized protein n=1 Tax=Leptospira interrogans serovar Hardjo str. Norma TaxID=1279460 RepID=A0A0M5LDJ7_LEPIR|nr:hypothetical protein G436_2616 [Leptospira interrogans serovar Hardjo str. Norma]
MSFSIKNVGTHTNLDFIDPFWKLYARNTEKHVAPKLT